MVTSTLDLWKTRMIFSHQGERIPLQQTSIYWRGKLQIHPSTMAKAHTNYKNSYNIARTISIWYLTSVRPIRARPCMPHNSYGANLGMNGAGTTRYILFTPELNLRDALSSH